MFRISTFCGGICQTNGYVIESGDVIVVVDAPEGIHAWLLDHQLVPNALLLTHLHFDHVLDAAAILEHHGCAVLAHSRLTAELHLGDLFAQFTGMPIEIRSFEVSERLGDKKSATVESLTFEVFHVPGHSPDSVCFYDPGESVVFAGDTLFQSGIGRCDFPGGDEALLLSAIREELFTLPDETRVLPGHGGPTTIGAEKAGNPFLR